MTLVTFASFFCLHKLSSKFIFEIISSFSYTLKTVIIITSKVSDLLCIISSTPPLRIAKARAITCMVPGNCGDVIQQRGEEWMR